MRVTLMHNPDAGDEGPSADTLRSLVEDAGHHVCYCSLDGDWKQALDRTSDLVAVAGGDGAVGKVFAELATRSVPVTVLPLGSANNIATALGIASRTIEELVQGWDTAPRSRYDLGEPGRFVESMGCGLFASMLERGSEGPSGEDKITHGLKVLRRLLKETGSEHRQVELDGADRSGEFLAVEAMVIGITGPNLVLAPLADHSDGLFDVVFITENDRDELGRYLDDRLGGRAARPPRLHVERAREVTFDNGNRPLRVDDRLLEEPSSARFSTGSLWVELAIPRT